MTRERVVRLILAAIEGAILGWFLSSSPAHADPWVLRSSYLPATTDDLSIRSLTLNAASGSNAVILQAGSKLCLDGSSCTRSGRWNAGGGVVDLSAPLRLTGGNSLLVTGPIGNDNSAGVAPVTINDGEGFKIQCINIASFPICDAGDRGGIVTACDDGNTYQCDGNGAWAQVYTTRDGLMPSADVDIPAHMFYANNDEDGYYFRALNDGCIDFGAGPGDYMCSIANELHFYSTTHQATTFVQVLAKEPQGSPFLIINAGGYTGESANNSLATCNSSSKGGRQTLSSDGRSYYCDGTTVLPLAVILSNTASLNFPNILAGDEKTMTMTVTGAVTTDGVFCSPLAPLEGGLVISYSYVSSADTVTITERNATVGDIDPVAVNFKCVITR